MDLDRLERVAREASPGPWEMTRDVKRGVKVWSHGKPLFTTIHGLDGSHVTEGDPNPQWLKDCDYLLATDPHDILTLIERVRRAEDALTDLHRQGFVHPEPVRGCDYCALCTDGREGA